MINSIAKLDKATQMLAEAKTLDDVKHIVDISEAAQTYAHAAKLGLDAQNHAAEICILAKRKAGGFLLQLEKATPQTAKIMTNVGHDSQYAKAIANAEISRQDAVRWQQIASVPESKVKDFINETKLSGKELTTTGILKVARQMQRDVRDNNLEKSAEIPEGVYTVIYADPPWRYDFSETVSREIENQYPTMELEEIKAMKIPVAECAALFLWATAPKLKEALEVMESWGFNYKTHAIWDKGKIGMGYWFRGQHELLLVGTKGNYSPPLPENRISSVIYQEREGHSLKPELYEIIEKMCPNGKYLELFARGGRARKSWTFWGNQSK